MSSWSWKTGVASATIVAATAYAFAQMPPGHAGMPAETGPDPQSQQPVPPQDGMHGAMHDRMMQMMHGGQQGMPGGMRHGMMGPQEGGTAVNPPCRDRTRSAQSRRWCKS